MIHVALTAAAVAVASVAVPAEAALYVFNYSAYAAGEQTVYDPTGPFCSTNPLGCLAQRPYSGSFGGQVTIVSGDGTGSFMIGAGCANCITTSGTIIGSLARGYTGANFVYAAGNPTQVGSIYATARTFSVQLVSIDGAAPVPEPATWGMLLLGFGAMGYTMRRKKVSTRIRLA